MRLCAGCGSNLVYVRKPPKYCPVCSSTCRHDGCTNPVKTAGMCGLHYKRHLRFGTTEPPRHSPHLKVTWHCEQCNKATESSPSRVFRFCSSTCSQAAQPRKAPGPTPLWRRRMHQRRKAQIRAGEQIDPIKVFERDGWKCQLCGIDTPLALRGTLDPSAPELDHKLPLSRGGEHTWANVQCACRRCNVRKGNKVLRAA